MPDPRRRPGRSCSGAARQDGALDAPVATISITLDTYSHVIEGMEGGLGDAIDEALG